MLRQQHLLAIACVAVAIACVLPYTLSQYTPYNSAPAYWYTFDAKSNNTNGIYTWYQNHANRAGVAYFDGITGYVNTYGFPDSYNNQMNISLGGASTIEFWGSFASLNVWSRLYDCSNGAAVDNVLLASNGGTANLISQIYWGTNSNNVTTAQAGWSIRPNQWQHFLVSLVPIPNTDNTSPTAATMSIYVNGVLYSSAVGSTNPSSSYLPRQIVRTNCYIGKSGWAADTLFNGWIDSMYYYNYGLSAEAAIARGKLLRPPVYEAVFAVDPRVTASITSATYSWAFNETTPNPFHTGILGLAAASSQYVNLAASSGNSAVGTNAFPTLGSSAASVTTNSFGTGTSIEVIFKVNTVTSGAHIFDFGNSGSTSDSLYLGFSGTSLVFQSYVSSTANTAITVASSVSTGVWHQFIIMMSSGGAVQVYLDGVSVVNTTSTYINAVSRSSALLGYSNAGGSTYFDGYIDAVRIYDYTLSPSVVNNLWLDTQVAQVINPPNIPVYQNSTVFQTYPVVAYTFDSMYNASCAVGGGDCDTSYDWYAGSGFHTGLAGFNSQQDVEGGGAQGGGGAGSFVDMTAYPDSNGNYLNQPTGGTMSIEMWVNMATFTANNAHIFDIAGVNGNYDNNILIGMSGTSTVVKFESWYGSNAELTGASATTLLGGVFNLGQWQHIVGVLGQNTSNPNSATNGYMILYVNGLPVASNMAMQLPKYMYRPNAYIGKSNWGADRRINALVDGLWVYNYALSPDQVLAHAQTQRPPAFELTFANDPRITANNVGSATYGWLQYNLSDAYNRNLSTYHEGIVTFDPTITPNQYINFTTTTGPHSVGTVVPVVGGQAYGVGYQVGWTFEVELNLYAAESYSKVFDLSNGAATDNILLGFTGTQSLLAFQVFNPQYTNGPGVTCVGPGSNYKNGANFQFYTWYHVVAVVTPNIAAGSPAGSGTVECYVNGVSTNTNTNMAYPQRTFRMNGQMAKSSWNDAYLYGEIDTFRIFDYALSADQIRALYLATNTPNAVLVTPTYQAGPVTAYMFDMAPNPEMTANNGAWTFAATYGGFNGVALFDGTANSFANMIGTPDSNGLGYPLSMGGGALSYEVWCQYTGASSLTSSWSRIFDIGNGAAAGNILLAHNGGNPELSFQIYGGGTAALSTTTSDFELNNFWVANVWYHMAIISVQTSSTACTTYIYRNGTLFTNLTVGTNPLSSNCAPYTQRQYAYLGKSNWGDGGFTGAIDSFYYYNYAIDYQSIKTHMLLPRNPIFELDFGSDPRARYGTGLSTSTNGFNWLNFDATDSTTDQATHTGLLSLNSTQYVDLSTISGINSIGTVLPAIGGLGYAGSAMAAGSAFTMGWSIEFVIKFTSFTGETNSNVFDFGCNVGYACDNLIVSFNGDPSQNAGKLGFTVLNNEHASGIPARNLTISSVTLNTWYHFVIVMTPNISDPDLTTGTQTAYVNGVALNSLNQYYPRLLTRPNAYIGESAINQATPPADMEVDRFAIYDYALSQATINNLVSQYPGLVRPIVPSSSSSSSTGATVSSSSSSSTSAPTTTSPSSSSSSARSSSAVSSSGTVVTSATATVSSSSSSSSAAVVANLGCTASSASGAIYASLIIDKPPTYLAAGFGGNFVSALNQATLAPTSVFGCASVVDSNGISHSTSSITSSQSQVNFYIYDNNPSFPPATVYSSLQQSSLTQVGQLTGANYVSNSLQQNNSGGGGGSGLSNGAIAGIVIGGVVGVCLLICLIVFVCCRGVLGGSKSNSYKTTSDSSHASGDQSAESETEMANYNN